MQTESSNTKKIFTSVLVLALVVFFIYFFFFRNTDTAIVFDEFGNPVEAQVVGQDLFNLLSELESVSLDSGIFGSRTFSNLADYSIILPDEPRGRNNPFGTLGR